MCEINYRAAIQQIREKYPNADSLTVSEVASYLNCDRRKVNRLIAAKKLGAVDIGLGINNIYRIPISDLARMLSKNQK